MEIGLFQQNISWFSKKTLKKAANYDARKSQTTIKRIEIANSPQSAGFIPRFISFPENLRGFATLEIRIVPTNHLT